MQKLNPGSDKPMKPMLETYDSYDDLIKYVKGLLAEVKSKTGSSHLLPFVSLLH